VLLRFDETENLLLSHLRREERITVSEFRQIAGINGRTAEKILSDFILCGLISYQAGEKGIFYRLSNEFATSG
jgi:predicted HTH transcriptional regulator